MDGLLGVAGMIITSDYGSFPHSLLSTRKKFESITTLKMNWAAENILCHFKRICTKASPPNALRGHSPSLHRMIPLRVLFTPKCLGEGPNENNTTFLVSLGWAHNVQHFVCPQWCTIRNLAQVRSDKWQDMIYNVLFNDMKFGRIVFFVSQTHTHIHI